MTTAPSESELTDAIANAAERAVSKLIAENPAQHFYYFVLVTTLEGHAPFLSAWSHEALAAALARLDPTDEGFDDDARLLRWSQAESPFCFYGEEFFLPVNRLIEQRPAMNFDDDAAWQRELELRLRAMESAMVRLDSKGLFGHGAQRFQTLVNVELTPPDDSNVARAQRLNPPQAVAAWLRDVLETEG